MCQKEVFQGQVTYLTNVSNKKLHFSEFKAGFSGDLQYKNYTIMPHNLDDGDTYQ